MTLLDTCAAIWAGTGDASLSREVTEMIDAATRADALALSAITAWEIRTLVRRGRLRLAVETSAFVARLFDASGVREIPVDRRIAERAAELGEEFGGDPADRLIVATALVRRARLVTRDRRILAYAPACAGLNVVGC